MVEVIFIEFATKYISVGTQKKIILRYVFFKLPSRQFFLHRTGKRPQCPNGSILVKNEEVPVSIPRKTNSGNEFLRAQMFWHGGESAVLSL